MKSRRSEDNYSGFTGFSKGTLKFLRDLGNNNNKVWFESNRQVYEKNVLFPLKELVFELTELMNMIDPEIETKPAVNKTISRIYRDVRFSKDKSPLRNNVWIVFKRPNKDWKGAPGYFFEIMPDYYRYGMGFYEASRQTMDKLREIIDNKPEDFLKVISFYRNGNTYELKGDNYKRIMNDTLTDELLDWYQKKSFYLVCNREFDDSFFSEKILNELISGFSEIVPIYKFLLNLSFSPGRKL